MHSNRLTNSTDIEIKFYGVIIFHTKVKTPSGALKMFKPIQFVAIYGVFKVHGMAQTYQNPHQLLLIFIICMYISPIP